MEPLTEPNEASNFRIKARMLRGAFALSLRRLAFAPAMLAYLGIAAIPLLIVLIVHLATLHNPSTGILSLQSVHTVYEGFLRTLYLHFVVFFIATILGSSVMRQDREEQTLHYLFLQPVARWMVIVAKLGAYLVVSSAVCVGSLWLTYLAMALPHCGLGAVTTDLFVQGRAAILARESMVLVLGLLAYGSFALLMGNYFKNATYALLLLAWEAGLPYLPSTLKFWTVMHYLQSLMPERLNEQRPMFELLGEPATTAMSLAVLLLVPCVFIGISIFTFRYRECLYGET